MGINERVREAGLGIGLLLMITLAAALISATGYLMCTSIIERRHAPPNYVIQTDGVYWRFVGLENDNYFTNFGEFTTRSECLSEAWKIYRFNNHRHEWRNE